MKQIDGIITNSFDLEKSLKNTVTNCPPVKTIYRGIEISEMEESDMTDQKYVFLYLGGLIPYRTLPFGVNTKGGISLMEAWKKAETKLIDNNCILQFGGPDSDNKIFKVWKQTLRYPERVKLLGKLAPEDINQFLSQSNIVVVPSMEEGLPNFLLESAARKKAAIGSTAGGIPEVIINGETGYIFEKGNIEQLTNLLLEASGNKEKVKQMGEAAYRRVKTNFNAENYSLNIMGFYKKIMNKCAE
jgi:glycosyltransferase involved in cell wall biosynthesis